MKKTSQCPYCGKPLKWVRSAAPFKAIVAGPISVPNVRRLKCTSSTCTCVLLPHKSAMKMNAYLQNRERELIEKQPISAFIASSEAAEILGVSPVEMRRWPKWKLRMVLSTKKGDRTFFLRKSVKKAARSKHRDGRYRLH